MNSGAKQIFGTESYTVWDRILGKIGGGLTTPLTPLMCAPVLSLYSLVSIIRNLFSSSQTDHLHWQVAVIVTRRWKGTSFRIVVS